jgi:hypothetical protein
MHNDHRLRAFSSRGEKPGQSAGVAEGSLRSRHAPTSAPAIPGRFDNECVPVYNESVDEHRWEADGHWQGPHDVRIFLRHNRLFAGFWLPLFLGIAWAVFTDVTHLGLIEIPLGLFAAGTVWFVFMFGFAHGWIAEGN